MKIYISLPITGRDFEAVEADSIFASGVIQRKGHTPVSPLEVSPDPGATYAEHIGTDITALLACDAVVFLDGYEYSKGCRLEYEATVIYGKEMYFDLDEIKNI